MDDIARYGAYLANEKNASQNTISSYLRDVTQFAEYLQNTQSCEMCIRDSISAGRIFAATEMTPTPPNAQMGRVSSSLPDQI